jgi:hypothetical protein
MVKAQRLLIEGDCFVGLVSESKDFAHGYECWHVLVVYLKGFSQEFYGFGVVVFLAQVSEDS